MATALTLQTAPKNTAITDITMVASDLAGNTFVNDGNTLLLMRNDDVAGKNVVITQTACSHGRTQTETIAIGASELSVRLPFDRDLYGATVTVTSDDADIFLAAVQYST